MISHFSLTAFVRSVSNDLLAEYFKRAGSPLELPSRTPKKQRAEAAIEAIAQLGDDLRSRIENDFREIHRLATASGIRGLIDEAKFQGVDLATLLRPHRGHLDKALQTYLDARPIFDAASRLAGRDMLPGRYWKRRLPVTGAPDIDPVPKLNLLKQAISQYFVAEEGRGGACKIDYYGRRPLHHFFAYPEDYSASPLVWQGANLQRQDMRPAFEVIFVYDEIAGCLDIYFEGGKQTVDELRRIFASTMLDIDQLPKIERPAYALEPFKSPLVSFVRDPNSEIADVRLKRLGFLILGGDPTKLSVEADPSRDRRAVFAVLDRIFARDADKSGRYRFSQAEFISASVQATIDLHDGTRPRTRTFDLSEHSCSLRYDGSDLALRRMLSDSGIDIAGRSGGEPSGDVRAKTA